jgi:hypothetical protein
MRDEPAGELADGAAGQGHDQLQLSLRALEGELDGPASPPALHTPRRLNRRVQDAGSRAAGPDILLRDGLKCRAPRKRSVL